ncbi:pyridoxal phosphate-dependent transferase [Talaromyces proteolyticus]|uniref:Pyridoxal phosphate-dependent transferase n=1 Tax=Talaromyces proteolyticus TaxID=1131652 RepID=A0AAD4KVZ8_9EURO|nr:pyridoxal phosphate-dependent transferase [Talaromyces proteolyticus]KAH8700518.1 pyridoxal phosphate-dependent transferase [Talaromyces proteolyticus]
MDSKVQDPLNEKPPGHNSWLSLGSAAYDFRGDVRTSPTAAMLEAVTYASLLDDLDRSDPSTKKLEAYLASLTGHEAGLWVVSGTMGNIVSLRSLLVQPPYSILCDERAHCLNNEAGGAFAFTGAVPQPVHPANDKYITLEDILPHIKLGHGEKVHACPTRVISLENTLRGMVMPLEETRRICDFAHANGIRVHLDGARLWEAVASGEGSLIEYCALFDTITMCFSKGLGAPAGAIVVGSEGAVRRARWIRQSIGGSIRQPGLLAEAAYVAVRDTFEGNQLIRTHHIAAKIAQHWVSCGGKLKYPTETNMIWLDFEQQPFGLDDLIKVGRERGIFIHRDRLVIHYQISDEAVQILLGVITRLTKHDADILDIAVS